jgi:hypothetical protein
MPLANDPNRWELAFVERGIRAAAAQGIKGLRVIDTFVTLDFAKRGIAKIVETPENLECFARDQPYRVWMPDKRLPPESYRYGIWRYRNSFRPFIDDLRRKLCRYRKREDDAKRLQTMADIWELCLLGKRVDKARRLAALIGEAEHFEEEMCPRYFPYAARLTAPDFPLIFA